MKLSKKQCKSLLDNINWEIEEENIHLTQNELKIILDKSIISYEGD